jgi:hypothetical protein
VGGAGFSNLDIQMRCPPMTWQNAFLAFSLPLGTVFKLANVSEFAQ